MKKRDLAGFKALHDPATVIANLKAELEEAQSQLGLERSVEHILGTTKLGLGTLDAPSWTVKQKDPGSPGVPTLFLSDLHWGERVDPREVNGVNEFNVAIARKRLKQTVETAIRLLGILDPKMRYPGIVVPLGGDMISGSIHDELTATNDMQTMPTVLDLFEQLTIALKTLADAFGNVFVPCVSGNHGRDTKKIWAKNRNHTSFDWLLYQFLAAHFAALGDKRIKFYIPLSADALYRIYGTRYLLTHGDQFKAGDSIIGAIGPLTRGRQKKLARDQATGRDFDIMIAGHWHTYMQLSGLIVNGSLKGADEYAIFGNFGFEPPQQALWVTHPDHAVTFRMPVLCEPKAGKSAKEWVSI